MRFNTFINNVKALEWGLNSNQAALFDLLNQVQSWAKTRIVGNDVYYHISRNKVISEIPLFYTKPDTVYRHFIFLEKKGLIFYMKEGRKDLIRLTEKGKEWNSDINPNFNENSEMNPTKLGNESEKNSEMNPTYNNTIYNNKTIDKREKAFKIEIHENAKTLDKEFTIEEQKQFFEYWSEKNRTGTKMKFELQRTWETKKRLKTWQNNNSKFSNKKQEEQPVIFKMKK